MSEKAVGDTLDRSPVNHRTHRQGACLLNTQMKVHLAIPDASYVEKSKLP